MLDQLNIPRQQEKVRGKYTNMYIFCDKFYLKKTTKKTRTSYIQMELLSMFFHCTICFHLYHNIILSYPQHIFIANLLKLVPEIQYAHGYRIICCMGANLTLWWAWHNCNGQKRSWWLCPIGEWGLRGGYGHCILYEKLRIKYGLGENHMSLSYDGPCRVGGVYILLRGCGASNKPCWLHYRRHI